MRVAIVSDIHGNRTAFEAVLADLRLASPDLILHGGDLVGSGSSPANIVDQIRDLGWLGVMGNTDEMLVSPQSLDDFASSVPALSSMFEMIREMAAADREALGDQRLAWLHDLPRSQSAAEICVVHASPASPWLAPQAEASDEDFISAYSPLDEQLLVYGHIHRPFVRHLTHAGAATIIANSGSVSLSYDGDPRASYLLIDNLVPSIRRVEYDVDTEVKALSTNRIPHFEWIARILKSATPQMP